MPDLSPLIDRGEAVLALTALFGGLWLLIVKTGRLVRKAVHAFDDIIGTPEDPGFADRLKVLEANQALIKAQLHPNGGSSLRDAVSRVEQTAVDVKSLAADAKLMAQEAADEAAALQAALGRADHKGSAERAELRQSMEALMAALLDFGREQRTRETLLLEAARDRIGLDLTDVVDNVGGDSDDAR